MVTSFSYSIDTLATSGIPLWVYIPGQSRLDIPGTLDHVMIRGMRRNIFLSDRDGNDLISAIR